MTEDAPATSPSTPAEAPDPTTPQPRTDFKIGEEFGTAKKNLPPVKIILIGVAVIAIIALIASFTQRPHSAATGTLDDVVAVEIPNQNAVMVAINVSFRNNGEKPYWIHTIQAEVDTDSGTSTEDAASPADFERYYQGFPALREHALVPLQREARINPGGQTKGTIIVSFPVLPDVFARRKALRVKIQPYDQPVPLILTK